MKWFIAIAVGLVVYVTVAYLMAMFAWTAIHSGWSQVQIDRFYVAVRVVPPLLGILSGLAAYGLITVIRALRAMGRASSAGRDSQC